MSKLLDTLRNVFWSTPTRKGWTLIVVVLLIASVLMRFIAPCRRPTSRCPASRSSPMARNG